MKVPREYYDEIFPFADRWGLPSACGLKIRRHGGTTYVIVTELYQENPGNSITYASEQLAEQICLAKGLNPASIVYIECAPDTDSKLSFYDEAYYQVNLGADLQHKYTRLSPERIKQILSA